jgi:glycosyltransferase involved in cell wall biosynthesis
MNILFLTKYGQRGGSSRYMVHNMLDMYEQAGISCRVAPLFDDRYFDFQLLERPTNLRDILSHLGYFVARTLRRLSDVIMSSRYDLVVFEKELLPYVPFGLEQVLKLQGTRSVVLFDDATYSYYRDHSFAVVRTLCRNKIEQVMRCADHVIVWNQTLERYAQGLNQNVSAVNTAIDIARYRVKNYRGSSDSDRLPIVIGWIGTPNSFPFIRSLEGVFGDLARRYDVELRVISSQPYASPNIRVVNHPWSLASEVDELLAFDIGIMPLPNTEWAAGKSGVKALQYMSVGVPAVCSPVGMNVDVILDGENGMLARDEPEWVTKLSALIEHRELRIRIGLNGRRTVESGYTKEAVAARLIQLFRQIVCSDGLVKVSNHAV